MKTNSAGYTYNGEFSTGNLTYFVQSSLEQTKNGKSVITKEENTITGALNMSCTQQISNKTSGDITTTTRILNVQIRNASGLYQLNLNSETLTSKDTANLISSSAQIDQNFFAPIGRSMINISDQDGANGMELAIRLPDGNEIITKIDQGLPEPQLTNEDFIGTGANGEYMTDSIIPGINDHGIDTIYDTRGDLELWCLRMWWLPSWEIYSFLYWFISDAILGFLATPLGMWTAAVAMGIVTIAQGVATLESGWFVATIDPYDVKIEYTDIELKSYNIGGLVVKFPYCWEIGFYSNRISHDYGNTFEYTGWYYYPVDTLCFGHLQSVYSMMQWKHADPWSLDPPEFSIISFLCYDESSSSYPDNIPIMLNNQWVPSATSVSAPAQQYTLTAPDSGGAFHYFNVAGTIYGNSPTITISGDTTIVAYYYWIPIFTVTLRAIEPYCYFEEYVNAYVDGNYAGVTPTTIQLPLGFHTFGFDGSVWDPMYWSDIYFLFMDDGYTSYGNNVNPAFIPIHSDTTVTAWY